MEWTKAGKNSFNMILSNPYPSPGKTQNAQSPSPSELKGKGPLDKVELPQDVKACLNGNKILEVLYLQKCFIYAYFKNLLLLLKTQKKFPHA